MFWGLILEPGKRYAQSVERGFHLSMAALDGSDAPGTPAGGASVTSLHAEVSKRSYALCHLGKGGRMQQALDLNFESGEDVAFYTSGSKLKVHLTGYLIPDDSMFESGSEGSEAEEVSEDENMTVGGKQVKAANGIVGLKRKASEAVMIAAKNAANEEDSDSEDSDFIADEAESGEEEESDSDEMMTTTDFDSSAISNSPSPLKKKAKMADFLTPKTPTTPKSEKKKDKKAPGTPHPGKPGGNNKVTPGGGNNKVTPGGQKPQIKVTTPQSQGGTPNTESAKKKKKRNRKSKGGKSPVVAVA